MIHALQKGYAMDSMDHVRERFEALEQQMNVVRAHTRTVERRLRWWRGFACGMVILALRSWELQASHVDLAAQVEAMQHDIAALQAILWHITTASHEQRDPEVGLTGAHLRIVQRASGSSTRTAPATAHGAAGAVFAAN